MRPPGEFGAGGSAMIDVDHDGTLDLCATFAFEKAIPAANEDGDSSQKFVAMDLRRRRSLVVGLSGRSGRCLWTHPVEPDYVEAQGDEVRPAEIVRGRRSSLVAFVAKTQWMGLDPGTGRVQAGPLELDFTPARPVAHADVDGDGEPEIVTVETGPGGRDWTLRVWSIGAGREVWSRRLMRALTRRTGPRSSVTCRTRRRPAVRSLPILMGTGGPRLWCPMPGRWRRWRATAECGCSTGAPERRGGGGRCGWTPSRRMAWRRSSRRLISTATGRARL